MWQGTCEARGWDYTNVPSASHVGLDDENKSVVVFRYTGTYGEIAHEAYHVLRSIYLNRNVLKEDEETTAYFLEDIVDDITEFLRTMKKRKLRFIVKPKEDKK